MRTTLATKIILTILSLTIPTRITLAQPLTAPASPFQQQRIVHFPPNRSMGSIWIQDEGIVNIPQVLSRWSDSPSEDQKWQLIGPAQGDIVVPPGKRLSLYIPNDKNIWKDLSPLKNLKPNDLYQLHIQGYHTVITNPNDTCMPHIAHLTGLKDLSLKWTNISKNGLQFIKDFHSLEYLHLPARIDDTTMIFINRFKSLKVLEFSGTGQVTNDGLAALQLLPNLEEITFNGLEKIDAMSLRHLAKIPKLKKISFWGKITDDGLIYLKDFPQLKSLMLSSTSITDSGLQFFSNLPHLEELDLYNTDVTDAGIPHLVKLKSLRRLNLRKHPYNKLNEFLTDKSAQFIAKLTNLECLELNHGTLTDFSAPEIAKLPKLKFLYASSSEEKPLTNFGLEHLAKIKSLEYLDISAANITDEGIASLEKLPDLRDLRLSFIKKITDKSLSKIANMENLECLVLGISAPPRSEHPRITISALSSLNKMNNLKSLELEGIIQDGGGLDISQLKNLEYLCITCKALPVQKRGSYQTYQSFTDNDLACLADLKNLTSLSLYGSDAVTDKGLMHLKDLTDLETLDLSDANLTDDGLACLKEMKKLEDLRIGGNFTEYGLQHLKQLKSLQSLYIYTDYGIPNRAVNELKSSLPNLYDFQLKTK